MSFAAPLGPIAELTVTADPPAPSTAVRKSARGPDWGRAFGQSARFYWNKMRHGLFYPLNRSGQERYGLVKEARVALREGLERLPYWAIRDICGIWRGGQPAWLYLQEPALSASSRTKSIAIRRLLAQLPARVSFHFVFSPRLADAEMVRGAFGDAGFDLLDVETYVCMPPQGPGEMIDRLTGKSIKGTLRRARRDLDLVEMTAEDYFRFQQVNLDATGRKNYRDINSDRSMLEEALKRGSARVLAARRKAGPANPGPFPFDAAMACLWDRSDGNYKIWRLTYRPRGRTGMADQPNPDASKLLILAAMEDAAAKGLILETDGSTPGLTRLYSTFGPGIFNRTMRLQCERNTLWCLLNTYYPFAHKKLSAFARWLSFPRPPPRIGAPEAGEP